MNTKNNPHWSEFIQATYDISEIKDLAIFFDIVFTHTEKVELAKRLKIIKELLVGNKPQREIAKELQVSLANVTRGSNVLKTTSHDLTKILNLEK